MKQAYFIALALLILSIIILFSFSSWNIEQPMLGVHPPSSFNILLANNILPISILAICLLLVALVILLRLRSNQ